MAGACGHVPSRVGSLNAGIHECEGLEAPQQVEGFSWKFGKRG